MLFPSTIGVSNFTSPDQASDVLEVFGLTRPKGSKRRLRIGVSSTDAVIGGIDTGGCPPREMIARIFQPSELAWNSLRFSWLAGDGEGATRISQALEWAGMDVHALEICMDWPDPGVVAEGVHRSRKKLEVTLRLRSQALEKAGNDPGAVVGRLEDYGEGFVHRVLFHVSERPGAKQEAMGLLPYVAAVHAHFPEMGIGVSSHHGLGVLGQIGLLVQAMPELSVETRLPWERQSYTSTYLTEAFKLLG